MAQLATTTLAPLTATQPPAAADPTTGTKDEPADRRMFQLTDLGDNHNKFYLVETWPASDGTDMVRFRATWGRVGSKPQVKEKLAAQREVERQIEEKLRKGYRPVELHRPTVEFVGEPKVEGPKIDPKVVQLVDWIFSEAGEHIESYLAVPVEALGQEQIDEGRRLLALAQKQHGNLRISPFKRVQKGEQLAATVQAYYNAIPTRLPARIDRDEVIKLFCGGFSEQEERLNQLEAAIATMKEQRQHPGFTRYQSLGAEIVALEPEHQARKSLVDYVSRTQVHGYSLKLKDVFEVCVPGERKLYEENKRGISRRELLFHGTRNRNVRHILRGGLICPKTPSNGRMLGNGIYLANKASKSANYCQASKRGVPYMLFVVEAALGNAYIAPRASAFNGPPHGYDSVWGKAGHTSIGGVYTLAHDEFVLYSPAQQTIRYLVTFER